MYTRQDFGKDLKQILLKTSDPSKIGGWAFGQYHKNISDTDDEVHEIAITLATMEDGPEFEYTIEELHEIANRLINGDSSIVHIGIDPNVKLKCKNISSNGKN